MESDWSSILLAAVASLIIIIAVMGLGDFLNWCQDHILEAKEGNENYRRVLRTNIHQLAEAIADEDPEEMTDPMLRDALATTITEHRRL